MLSYPSESSESRVGEERPEATLVVPGIISVIWPAATMVRIVPWPTTSVAGTLSGSVLWGDRWVAEGFFNF